MKKILLIGLCLSLFLLSACRNNLPPIPDFEDADSTESFADVCRHEWSAATCLQPRTCLKCNKTIGNTGFCKDDGTGKCVHCQQDILLNQLKANFSVRLVPASSGENNYYTRVKYLNNTDMTVLLDSDIVAGGKACRNMEAEEHPMESGDEVSVLYYRSIGANRDDAQYNDLYLDEKSLAHTSVQVNGKTVYFQFDVNGVVNVGYSLQEIGVEMK